MATRHWRVSAAQPATTFSRDAAVFELLIDSYSALELSSDEAILHGMSEVVSLVVHNQVVIHIR
jgi:hypothetical protein